MRHFVVTNPNLSVGKPGDIVTAAQLRMDDAKLDVWVAAGYGMEIDSESLDPAPTVPVVAVEPPPAPTVPGVAVEPPPAPEPDGYDPGDHTVPEVLAYIEANPDETDAVIGRELNGRRRAGIITAD